MLDAVQSGEVREGRALQAPTHSSKRQAGQGHVHEAIVPAEAPAAGSGQHLLDHLGKSGRKAEGLSAGARGSAQPLGVLEVGGGMAGGRGCLAAHHRAPSSTTQDTSAERPLAVPVLGTQAGVGNEAGSPAFAWGRRVPGGGGAPGEGCAR